ncbi:MAG TPA: PfkB family carbohydrate kinase [Pyrinomonadaceae bacterium]|nr:PfkB family carbohydrate kinase [Pyrinomonadaceae bacterium]
MTETRAEAAGRLAALVGEFTRRRVTVVGDLVADRFVYGEISRVSREAPVLILRHERTETVAGGAANCAANLASLGARAAIVGVVGDDAAGLALLENLRAAGVDCDGVTVSPAHETPTKVRILAGHSHSTRQQVIRLDYEGARHASDDGLRAEIARRASDAAAASDAVIISDYDYGVAAPDLVGHLRAGAERRPVLVDSRFRLAEFAGVTSATPNEDEVEQLAGERLDTVERLEAAGLGLRERLDLDALLITRGSRGMMLVERGRRPFHLAAVGAHTAVDVTGAGDTVIAAYTLALASGATYGEAARLANHAGGVVVTKRGTATVSGEELLASVRTHEQG